MRYLRIAFLKSKGTDLNQISESEITTLEHTLNTRGQKAVICEIASFNGNHFLGGVGGFGILTLTPCLSLVTGFLGGCLVTFGGLVFFCLFLVHSIDPDLFTVNRATFFCLLLMKSLSGTI
ncbi:MAG: hypothetical protein ACL7BU_06590 [Candidatus Phlomobacter fragariae]